MRKHAKSHELPTDPPVCERVDHKSPNVFFNVSDVDESVLIPKYDGNGDMIYVGDTLVLQNEWRNCPEGSISR